MDWVTRRQTGPGELHQFANSRWPRNSGWTSPEEFGSLSTQGSPALPWSAMVTYSQLKDNAEVSIQPHAEVAGRLSGPRTLHAAVPVIYREDNFPGMEALDQIIASTYFLFSFQVFHDTSAWPCPVSILPYFKLLIFTTSSQFPVTSCFIQS